MKDTLQSKLWPQAMDAVRKCHLSLLQSSDPDAALWKEAFDLVIRSVRDERETTPTFANELFQLDDATGVDYSFKDIFEEYFDLLEREKAWDTAIASAEAMLETFDWKLVRPSEYLYRKGTALEKSGRFEEAEAFGKTWLTEYPDDLYAAASNVFLLIELKKYDAAKELVEKYMSKDMVCDNTNDTFFMAAYRLFEMTEDINAKQRVEQRISEYNALIEK